MSIEALARELVEVRTNSKRLLEEGDIDGWLATLTPQFLIAEQLRSYLLSHPVVVTGDPSVKCLLRSIDQTDLEDHHKTGKQLLFSLISPAEYACRLAEVTVLVAPSQVPPALRNFLDEARQCYAFGQLSAVQSLSRTILEAAVNDIAVRTGRMPREAVEKDMFRRYPPKWRIRLVAGSNFELVYRHYTDLCKAVHGLSTDATSGALASLTKTIGFVEHLYDQHKEQIRRNRIA